MELDEREVFDILKSVQEDNHPTVYTYSHLSEVRNRGFLKDEGGGEWTVTERGERYIRHWWEKVKSRPIKTLDPGYVITELPLCLRCHVEQTAENMFEQCDWGSI